MANPLKTLLKEGQTIYGTMLQEFRDPAIMPILANAGFDFVFVDMEHGSYNTETVADLMLTARLCGLVPLVRVPDAEYHLMARVLDQGAMGVMVPRVETVETVRKIVASCKYPPVGVRGASVARQALFKKAPPQAEFVRQRDEEVMVILQIERKQAIAEIDALLSVPGVDVALMGPNDLALSLGAAAMDAPECVEATQKVVDAVRRHGLLASGMHVRDVKMLKAWHARGMRMLVCHTDVSLLTLAATQTLQELKA